MKLKIFGAAGEVTGSNYMIETSGYKALVDCGFYQGLDEEKHEDEPFPYNPADIDALLLTHAHIDHSGRIPLLVKKGFKGKVYCTHATGELVEVMWRDSAKIMKEEAEWRTRKNARRGMPAVEALFDENDVEDAIRHKETVSYYEIIEIFPGLKVRFQEAGHILGSAIIETWVSEEGRPDKTVKVVFSGDLGPAESVIENPRKAIEDADFVFIESTYGDRQQKDLRATRAEFQAAMEEALKTASKVLIPTFVVDRAQRMLYEFVLLQKKLGVQKMPPIFLDSPMGVKTTEIYAAHKDLLSKDLRDLMDSGEDPFAPEGFQFIRTPDESKEINERPDGIVLAGSGMVSGGRIMHHIKHSIYKPDTHIFFVGYQARGTLGRRIVDGAKEIRIAGEDVAVRAQIHTLNGFSAHADRDDLLSWASNFPKEARFIVVHGEPKSAEALALGLKDMGYVAHVPALGEEIDLLATREESAARPLVSPLVREGMGATGQDLFQALSAIISKADDLQKTRIDRQKYKQIIPLLVSAKTLLETAETISGAREKKS